MTADFRKTLERVNQLASFLPPPRKESLLALEEMGLVLPSDLREFYAYCDGGVVHIDDTHYFDFFRLEALRTEVDIENSGPQNDALFAGRFVVFCEVCDQDYLVFQNGAARRPYPILFLSHELGAGVELDDLDLVSTSFEELILELEKNNRYWWFD